MPILLLCAQTARRQCYLQVFSALPETRSAPHHALPPPQQRDCRLARAIGWRRAPKVVQVDPEEAAGNVEEVGRRPVLGAAAARVGHGARLTAIVGGGALRQAIVGLWQGQKLVRIARET